MNNTTADISPRGALRDSFGRTVNNLRISVTDRCNFRCTYCMPEGGMQWMKRSELLTYEELARLAGIFAGLGITKIRLTGGEPLMRSELHLLIGMLKTIASIRDIALTTNGYFLAEQAEALARAGLSRINVSMDSVDRVTFSKMVRRDYLDRVQAGLREIRKYPVGPVKINVVLVRGVNDGEIENFARLAREERYIIRFIEFMPIGAGDEWSNDKVVPTAEILARINAMGVPLVEVETPVDHPADRFQFEDGKGEIGFISSVSNPFCGSCNRIRLTSDGALRTCLFSLVETDLKSPLRSGASDAEISTLIRVAVSNKEEGHLINRPGFVRPERTMSRIGG